MFTLQQANKKPALHKAARAEALIPLGVVCPADKVIKRYIVVVGKGNKHQSRGYDLTVFIVLIIALGYMSSNSSLFLCNFTFLTKALQSS